MQFKTNRIHAASLIYFDAARQAKSIRDASRRLNVASSSVNRQILQLEAEIGAKLFDRLPTGLRLTAAGEILARHVTNVLNDAERLQSNLEALRRTTQGRVELLTLDGLCYEVVPSALERLRYRHPELVVSVTTVHAGDMTDAILAGDSHLGLTFDARTQRGLKKLTSVPLGLGLAVPASHELARRSSVELCECRGLSLVVPKDSYANHDQLLPLLQQHDLLGACAFETGSVEMMKQFVLRGLGAACLTRLGLEQEIRDGRIAHVPLRVDGKELDCELGLYCGVEDTLSGAARILASELRNSLVSLDSRGNTVSLADQAVRSLFRGGAESETGRPPN